MGFSLPWVPLDMQDNGIVLMRCEVARIGEGRDAQLHAYCLIFMTYLEHQWMDNPDIPRGDWNFFNDDEISNNNMCEGGK